MTHFHRITMHHENLQ